MAPAQTPSEAPLATFRLENNSDFVYKLALLAYLPSDSKNETRHFRYGAPQYKRIHLPYRHSDLPGQYRTGVV
jgi:hypothetical protein